jgi:hypothetical protein
MICEPPVYTVFELLLGIVNRVGVSNNRVNALDNRLLDALNCSSGVCG